LPVLYLLACVLEKVWFFVEFFLLRAKGCCKRLPFFHPGRAILKKAQTSFVMDFCQWKIFRFWFSDMIQIRIFVRLKLFSQKLVNYFVTLGAKALI